MTTYQLPARHNEDWTEADNTQLNFCMRFTNMTVYEVATEMQRTPMAILLQARKVAGFDSMNTPKEGELYKHHTRWTDSENYDLKQQFQAGKSIDELARYFDRSHDAIESHLRVLLENDKTLDATYQRIRKLRKLNV